MKRCHKILLLLLSIFVFGPLFLDIYIRHERKMLQTRAKVFLSQPIPAMFQTNEIGMYQARSNHDVLFVSRALIERYAKNGRIRWSAAIQGQFAVQPFETSACEEAAITNEAARIYVAECKAIIAKEWRMGFWQWIEDTMEFKKRIPEIEEEDFKSTPKKQFN